MSVVLPKEIDFNQIANRLPDGSSTINVSINPINGSSFSGVSGGSQIIFDLPNDGYLDGSSMYLTYYYDFTNAATCDMLGACVAASPIARVDVVVSGQVIESILDANILTSHLYTMTTNVASRYGWTAAIGTGAYGLVTDFENVSDGRTIAINEKGSFSFPLLTCLASCDKFIPLFCMGQVRIILTLAPVASYFTLAAAPTAATFSQWQLDYKSPRFGPSVDASVMDMVDSQGRFLLKMSSWATQATTIAANSSGTLALPFNLRYSSVKSIFAFFGTASTSGTRCRDFDSTDISGGIVPGDLAATGGTYQWSIGGFSYPQRAISTVYNKTRALQELRQAIGVIHDSDNSMCINTLEFYMGGVAGQKGTDCQSIFTRPGKFIFASNTQRVTSESLLSGISTQLAPIILNITTTGIGSVACVCRCAVNFDLLLEVFPATKQLKVNV